MKNDRHNLQDASIFVLCMHLFDIQRLTPPTFVLALFRQLPASLQLGVEMSQAKPSFTRLELDLS